MSDEMTVKRGRCQPKPRCTRAGGRGESGKIDLAGVQAPADIRRLGGALFGNRRFGHVFIYHYGAQSYYSGRGFRGVLRV